MTATVTKNSRDGCSGEIGKVANGQEAVVGIPVIVEPIEVEVALGTVLVEIRHVAVAIDLRDGALCEKPSVALSPDGFARTVSNL